jgi:hypothetical protein
MSNNFFSRFVNKFSNNNSAETLIGVESVTAEVSSTSSETSDTINVKVRYRLRSEEFSVKAGTKMSELFRLVTKRFSIGNLETVSVLNEETNNVQSYSEVADEEITEEQSISVEDTSGTAG